MYWIKHNPEFGKQAVFLDGRYEDPSFDHRDSSTWVPSMEQLVSAGVNYIAPPLWMLLQTRDTEIVPSYYAQSARAAGLDIITWTLERSGPLNRGGGWYYQTISPLINNDGDLFTVLDVLAKDVGVKGVFSDWPKTVSYYAHCMRDK